MLFSSIFITTNSVVTVISIPQMSRVPAYILNLSPAMMNILGTVFETATNPTLVLG